MIKINGLLKQSSIFSKLLLMAGVTSFFTILALLFWTLFSNGDITDINTVKLMQLFQSIGMFVIPPFILSYLWSEKPMHYLQIEKKTKLWYIIFIVIFMIIAIPFINLLGEFNQQMVLPKMFAGIEAIMKASELQTAKITEQLLNVHNLESLLFNIFLIALLPALGEELFFRGILQRIFQEWKGATFAIWVSAFIFSAIHFQFYGFLPRLLLGAFFGYLLVWSGNLWLPILAHFINNLMAVIFYYLKNNGYQAMDIDIIGTEKTQWLGWISCGVAVIGIIWLRNKNTKESLIDNQK